MKKTGKPPQKSSRKPAGRPGAKPFGKAAGKSTGKPAGKSSGKPAGKPGGNRSGFAAKSRDERDNRHVQGRGESRFDQKPFKKRQDGADRPKRDFGDRPARNDRGSQPRDTVRTRDTRPPREERAPREPKQSIGPRANLFGLHAVREAWLNPKRSVHAIYLTEQNAAQFEPVMERARDKGLGRPPVKILDKDDFDKLLGRDTVHQGAAMSAAPLEEAFVQDLISIGAEKDKSVILMLDQVTDPHNVGAILRSACAFGADGVVMQRRHAPELEGIVAKAASGAAEHIPVAYETNLSRTLEELSDAGYTIIGLDEHSDTSLSEVEVPDKAVLILGNEGEGMRRLIREHCNVLVTLPTQMPIASLNVSNAAAVALYALLK